MTKNSVGIIGLGYVGLPLALEFCRVGFHVVGVDIDKRKIGSLRQGNSYIGDVCDQDVKEFVAIGLLNPTTEFSELSEVEGISICVPTPLRKTREPDCSSVANAAQ